MTIGIKIEKDALKEKIDKSNLTLTTKINNTPITYNQAEIEQNYTFTLSELLRTKIPTRPTYPQATPPARPKAISKSKRYYEETEEEPYIQLSMYNLFTITPIDEALEQLTKHAKLS